MVFLFAASFALRIGYVAVRGTLAESPTPQRGYREYVLAGQRLLEHGTLVSPLILEDVDPRPSALMPPGYAGFVAVMYALFGVESRVATLCLQLINAAATSLAVVLVFFSANAIAGRRAGWIAAAVAAVNPTLIRYTDFIWDTSLFCMGVALAVWWSQRLRETDPGAGQGFAFGAVLGVLALLNPAMTVAYPILILLTVLRGSVIDWKAARRFTPAVLVGWALLVAPWTIRNYVHFGQWLYIRGGLGHELWLGACPEAETHGAGVFRSQFPLNNQERQEYIARVGETAYIREAAVKARKAILADPVRFLRLSGARFIDFWCGTTWSHSRVESVDAPPSKIRVATTAFISLELAAIFVGIVVGRGLDRPVRWLLYACGLFCIVYVVTHVQLRFRAPIEPIVAMILGVAIVRPRPERLSSTPTR